MEVDRAEMADGILSVFVERNIPEAFDFRAVPQLRMEARDKLSRHRPVTLGQAGRVSGITPADLAVLMFALKPRLSDESATAQSD